MIPAACPAFDDQALGVAHALASVDCRVGLVVSSSYGRLFGHDGVFGAVLTALLTLYVAVIALGLMTGRTRLTLSGMAPRVVAIGLVLTFATSWPAYHAVIYGLLVGGPDQVATAVAGADGNSISFAARLDDLLDRFADVAKTIGDTAPGASKALGPLAGPQIAAALVWVSGMLILLASAGALVLTRIVLALLLAIGPVFVVLGLFRQTRGLFEGWLRTAALFAFAPTLTVLAGAAALAILGPLVEVIADDPATAVASLRPILELFVGSVVYVSLVGMLMWTAASLVGGWRLGRGADTREPFVGPGTVASRTLASNPAAGADIGARAPAPQGDHRVGQTVASLTRDRAAEVAPVSVRVEQATGVTRSEPGVTAAPVAGGLRRTEGLGHGIRATGRPGRISGAFR